MTIFVCLGAVWNSEVFDGDFVPWKNDRKDVYVQRKIFIINAIVQGILATSKTLAVKCAYLNNAYGLQSWCRPLGKQPSHPPHMTKSGKTAKLDWFTDGIFTRSNTTQKNMYYKYMVFLCRGGGGASLCPPPCKFRAEKRSAQASAHPLSQAQGGLFCLMTGLDWTVPGLAVCLFVKCTRCESLLLVEVCKDFFLCCYCCFFVTWKLLWIQNNQC